MILGIVFAGIMPHPPLLVPAVGGREIRKVEKSVQAMKELSRRLASTEPERLVIITPHGPVFREAITAYGDKLLRGDFARFGASEVSLSMQIDLGLLECLKDESARAGIPLNIMGGKDGVTGAQPDLDHGAGVPLYYLQEAGIKLPGLHLTFGLLSPVQLLAFGKVLQQSVLKVKCKTALIASGDLSHRLTPNAPAGYEPRGAEFDRLFLRLLTQNDVNSIINLEQSLVEAAGECGLRSFIIALGALDGLPYTVDILSYEGPFGVGYLVAEFRIDKAETAAQKESSTNPGLSDIITGLVRKSIAYYLEQGKPMPAPETLPGELLNNRGGTFVSLKKKGILRGCIGTIEGVYSNLAGEIIANAVSAGFSDPRFPPLKDHDLQDLLVSVDILSPMEKVEDISQLDPRRYGILVQCGHRSGLLLPDLQGIDSVEDQLSVACQKGGIMAGEKFKIYRFTVTRYTEKEEK